MDRSLRPRGPQPDDLVEGYFGRRRSLAGEPEQDAPPTPSGRSARMAWFNRPRGAPEVELARVRDSSLRRVFVRARAVDQGGGGGRAARALARSARYLERDGVDRDGAKGGIFDRELDRADVARFVERSAEDRHYFRIVISPEDGAELADLRTYTRELMRQVGRDLDARLDWVAAEHHDTGRAHVHLLLRGRDQDGRDLKMPREYLRAGIADRAEQIATRELGPRLETERSRDLDRRAERTAGAEQPTYLDELLRERVRDNQVRVESLPQEGHLRAALVQRLNRLEDWGLAQRREDGAWRLDPAFEDRLLRRADMRDRERATARLLAREDRGVERERLRELEAAHSSQRATGRLIGFTRLGPNPPGPQIIAVEGIDGKTWTARVANRELLRELTGVEPGAIVRLERGQPDVMPLDRVILAIARENGFVYSAELHSRAVPSDRPQYIRSLEHRLAALRRAGLIEKTEEGVFLIPEHYEERARRYEARGARESARVTLLDPHALEKQISYRGPTWLDRVGMGLEDGSQLAAARGFGMEIVDAWAARARTLELMGVAARSGERVVLGGDWQSQLRQMEKEHILRTVEMETGRVPRFARDGDEVAGVFVDRIRAAERSYAVIVHERSAALVPWTREMDRSVNQLVEGRVEGLTFDFKTGRDPERAMKHLAPWLGR